MAIDYQQKKQEIESKFNQKLEELKILQSRAQELNQLLTENATERARLQGEFRLLEDMTKAKQKPVEVKPTTVKVIPSKKKK